MLSNTTRRAARALPVLRHARASIWGVAPEPTADPLWLPLDIESPMPLFDGPSPTKVPDLLSALLCTLRSLH